MSAPVAGDTGPEPARAPTASASASASAREPTATAYVVTWLGLAVLATISFLASSVDLGSASVALALAIAGVKALLVFAVFMHLAYGPPIHRLVIGIALAFVVLVVAGVLADVSTRRIAGPDTSLSEPGPLGPR